MSHTQSTDLEDVSILQTHTIPSCYRQLMVVIALPHSAKCIHETCVCGSCREEGAGEIRNIARLEAI